MDNDFVINVNGQTARIAPGGCAVGDGRHPTTRLCQKLLEHHIRPGDRMLDLGCGSGILSIAALLCGAGHVTARDCDAVAVRQTRRNLEANGFDAGRWDVNYSDLLRGVNGQFDLIVCNIAPGVAVRLCPELSARLRPDGAVILSGFRTEKAPEILVATERSSYACETHTLEGWAAVEGQI